MCFVQEMPEAELQPPGSISMYPLSGTASYAPSRLRGRQAKTQELASTLDDTARHQRWIFMLIRDFNAAATSGAAQARLCELLELIIDQALLIAAAERRRDAVRGCAERTARNKAREKILEQLARLQAALAGPTPPGGLCLAHALDSLIVHYCEVDGLFAPEQLGT